MSQRSDTLALDRLALTSGQGRRLDLEVAIDGFEFGGQTYAVDPSPVAVRVDVSRMTHAGWALRLRFEAGVEGPCMRCLEPAEPVIEVDAREVHQPGGGPELTSEYVEGEELDLKGWVRDALALTLPAQITCRPDCAGLCPVCGENLNEAGPDHHHDPEPDSRWAKLSELRFDEPAA